MTTFLVSSIPKLNQPGEWLGQLLAHLGIARANRKGIYQGDVIVLPDRDNLEIAEVIRSEGGAWFLQISASFGKKLSSGV